MGLGILQITSAKRCPQVWSWFGRSLFSTNFVEFDQAVVVVVVASLLIQLNPRAQNVSKP